MKIARDYPRLRKVKAGQKKLGPLVFRPTPDLKEKLEAAAAKSAQSLSSEIERRLEQSLWRESELQDAKDEAAGGAHNRALAFLLQRVAVGVEHQCGRSWKDDPQVQSEVATSIVYLLQLLGAFQGAKMPLPMKGKHLMEFDRLWHVPLHSARDNPDPAWWFIAGMLKSQVEIGNLAWPLTAAMKPAEAKAQARGETPALEVLRLLFPEKKTPRRSDRAGAKVKEAETPE